MWNKYSQSCKPSFLGASNAKILAFDHAHKEIQREAVLDTLSRVQEEKGTELILPYCYQ